MNMHEDRTKEKLGGTGGGPDHVSGGLPSRIDVKDRLRFIPKERMAETGEAAMDWDLELEGRYRTDGTFRTAVDLNYRQARMEVHWIDQARCTLACRSASDGPSRNDLRLGGFRAVLAVHRYLGRINRIAGSERSTWLTTVVLNYCTDGGPQKSHDTTDLMRAAGASDVSRIQELLKLAADVNAEDMLGNTAASYAARSGADQVFETLVSTGAHLDTSFEGRTVLHDAATGGNVSIISHLLRAGLNVNSVDWCGRTPIWEAVSEGKAEAAEYLLAEGADPTMQMAKATYPGLGWGLDLLSNTAAATLGNNHRLTRMLREIDQLGSKPK